jgi:hypothetical protein
VALKGSRELRARLRAIKLTFKPAGKDWADETARVAKTMVPSKTGRLRGSIRRRNATQRKATVVAHYTAYFIDKGTKRHAIPKKAGGKVLRFERGGNTIFSRKVDHPRTAARPFRERAAREGLRRRPLAGQMIREWNDAA